MSTTLETMRCRLEAQGYVGLSDEELAEVGPWGRLATGLCMTWALAGTLLGSAQVIWALVPLAALGALMPWHPFDLIYNHGIRHLTGTRALPRHGAPRRFACSIATVWLLAAGWAFNSGATTLGYVLGSGIVIAAAVPTLTDFCIPSYFYGLMFGVPKARERESA